MVEIEVERHAFQLPQRRLDVAMAQTLLHTVQEELQHDATLAIRRRSEALPHSALNPP
jgi:hypothetical protein